MSNHLKFYIDGAWVEPAVAKTLDVINPATEEPIAKISLGSAEDVDRAVAAARRAFATLLAHHARRSASRCCSASSKPTRRATTTSPRRSRSEMGAPLTLATKRAGGDRASAHLKQMIAVLKDYEFEELQGTHADRARADRRLRLHHAVELADQPDHVQGRAGARGRLHDGAEAERDRAAQRHHLRRGHARGRRAEGRVQPGQRRRPDRRPGDRRASRRRHGVVHRLDARRHRGRQGRGRHGEARAPGARRQVGQHHPAPTPICRRPCAPGVNHCFNNSGQSCNAPTRMLVPREPHDEAVAIAKAGGRSDQGRRSQRRGHGARPGGQRAQFDKIQRLIEAGIEEGATLVDRRPGPAGGPQPRLLRAADGVRQRQAGHDHRARGDLRAGALDPALRERGAGDRASPTTRSMGWPATCSPAIVEHARKVASQLRAGQVSAQRRRPATSRRRSAATSSPATAANGASSASRSSSRSRPCSATRPPKPTSRKVERRRRVVSPPPFCLARKPRVRSSGVLRDATTGDRGRCRAAGSSARPWLRAHWRRFDPRS